MTTEFEYFPPKTTRNMEYLKLIEKHLFSFSSVPLFFICSFPLCSVHFLFSYLLCLNGTFDWNELVISSLSLDLSLVLIQFAV